MPSVMWVLAGILVLMFVYGCSDQFGVISMMLADDVAPVVEITSRVNGDEYLLEIRQIAFAEGRPSRDLEAIFIDTTVVEKTAEGVRGIIGKMWIDVIGYPDLSGSWNGYYPNQVDERAGFAGIVPREAYLSCVAFFDISSLAGNITVRISVEDWNGNIGSDEVELVPPAAAF